VAQNLLLGPLFMPLYALLWVCFGYRRHPLERDARAASMGSDGEKAVEGGVVSR